MESPSKLRPGKRKRRMTTPSSNPLSSGVFTRRRSRIFSHCNRSGRSRPDPKVKPKSDDSKIMKKQRRLDEDLSNLDSMSRASVVDLRSHRVFSPASVTAEQEGFNSSPSYKDLGCEEPKENSKLFHISEKSSDVGSDLKVVDVDLGTASDIATGNGMVKKDAEIVGEGIHNQVVLSPSNEKEGENVGEKNDNEMNISSPKDFKIGSIPKAKPVLKTCTRKKLFKVPSSVSYRRLLPFLMEAANSDNLDGQCHAQKEKDENARCNSRNPQWSRDRKLGVQVPSLDKDSSVIPNSSSGAEMGTVMQNIDHVSHKNGLSNDDQLTEEQLQTTPPEPDMLAKANEDGRKANVVFSNLQSQRHPLGNPANDSSSSVGHERSNSSPNRRSDTSTDNTMVPSPCSRLKLFKIPSSVSYRKLLPYLMEAAKDNSCSSVICHHPKESKDLGCEQSSASSVSQEIKVLANVTESSKFSENQHIQEFQQESAREAVLDPDAMSMSTPFVRSNDQSEGDPGLPVFDDITVSERPMHLQSEQPYRDKHDDLMSLTMLEPAHDHPDTMRMDRKENCTVPVPCSPTNDEILPIESAVVRSEGDAVSPEVDSLKGGTQLVDTVNLHPYIPGNGVTYLLASKTDSDGQTKGILKKNPRGCRGLCNCLSCASFRLHAERAFEFSKNLMQDAEEVASMLMKELADIRGSLGKSLGQGTSQSIKSSVVNEVCRKALETEHQAKERLNQMNDDLHFHCRNISLERPRVTFASYKAEDPR